jgi:hypothetical protein
MTESDTTTAWQDAVLGETSGKQHLNTVIQCRLAALSLATQTGMSICIFSHDLEPQIYNQTPFLDAVKELAIGSRQGSIRILLQDNEKVQREGHRLVHLWRRLTSKIEIRRPHRDYMDHPESFLVVDQTGYLRHRTYTGYEAIVDFNSRLEAGKLAGFFDEVWEQSEPDSELRGLNI